MPDKETIRRWLEGKPDFRAQYARARQEQGHALIDEAIDEARACKDSQSAAAARVKVDCYFRAAAKLHPKVYGEKSMVEHTGADGGAIQTETRIVTDLGKCAEEFEKFSDDETGQRVGGRALPPDGRTQPIPESEN